MTVTFHVLLIIFMRRAVACIELIPVTVFIDFVIAVVSPGFPHRQRAVGVLPRRRVPPGAAAVRLGQRLSGLSDDGSLSAVHPLQRAATLCQGAHAAGLCCGHKYRLNVPRSLMLKKKE